VEVDERRLGATRRREYVVFEGLYLNTIRLKSAETFSCSAHGNLRAFLTTSEDGHIHGMVK